MPQTALKENIAGILTSLCEVAAVTGHEDNLQKHIRKMISAYASSTVDALGNLTARHAGTGGGWKIMLCAHMDEIGFIVRAIDTSGFLYLYPLGGIPSGLGPGLWVTVHAERGPVYGTTGIHPPHLPVSGSPPLFVDVGAGSRHQAMAMGIKIGDPVTVDCTFRRLNDERVMGRCLDNRMGCAVLIATLKLLAEKNNTKSDIYAVFSSTEEHGMHPGTPPEQVHGARGAYLAATTIKPDLAVVLDSMAASDIPGLPEHERLIHLGKGVSLRLVDDMSIMRPGMRRLARAVAEKYNIKFQEGISRSFTDASVVQLAGAAVLTLGIPLRYIHSPGQVASLTDIESAVQMVTGVIDFLDNNDFDWIKTNFIGN